MSNETKAVRIRKEINEARAKHEELSNEQLVIHIQAGIDTTENMAQLWQQNQGIIGQLAGKYSHLAEEEDLKQEGYFGLWEAAQRYNPKKGVKFLTYAAHWIRQKMVRYIHNNGTVRIPVHENERLMQYNKLCNAFLAKLNRMPAGHEISRYLGISIKQARQLQKDAEMAAIGSLDSPVAGAEDIVLGDSIASNEDIESSILDKLEAQQLKDTLWPLVDALPGKQPEVIRARYQEGRTLEDVGREMGVTGNMVRQIQATALRELRKPSRADQLRPFLDEVIYSKGIRGGGNRAFSRTWTSSTEWAALDILQVQEENERRMRELIEIRKKEYQSRRVLEKS